MPGSAKLSTMSSPEIAAFLLEIKTFFSSPISRTFAGCY